MSAGAKAWRSRTPSIGTWCASGISLLARARVSGPWGGSRGRAKALSPLPDGRAQRATPQALSPLPVTRALLLVRRRHARGNAAARREIAHDGHPPRGAGGDQVVENLVGDGLVEDALVAEVHQVILQSLQLDAALVGHA